MHVCVMGFVAAAPEQWARLMRAKMSCICERSRVSAKMRERERSRDAAEAVSKVKCGRAQRNHRSTGNRFHIVRIHFFVFCSRVCMWVIERNKTETTDLNSCAYKHCIYFYWIRKHSTYLHGVSIEHVFVLGYTRPRRLIMYLYNSI